MSGIRVIVLVIATLVIVGLVISVLLSPKSLEITSAQIDKDLHVHFTATAKNIKYLEVKLTTPSPTENEEQKPITLGNTHHLGIFPKTVSINEKIPLPGLEKIADGVYKMPEGYKIPNGTYKLVVKSTADAKTVAEKTFTFTPPAVKIIMAIPDLSTDTTPDETVENTTLVRITKVSQEEVVVETNGGVKITTNYGKVEPGMNSGFTITEIPSGRNEVIIVATNWCGETAEKAVSVEPLRVAFPLPAHSFRRTASQALVFAVRAAGATPPYSYTAQGAPDGATLDSVTGQFKWPRTTTGDYPVTLMVTDASGQRAEISVQIQVINPFRITFPPPNHRFPTNEQGEDTIGFTVQANGGTPPYGYEAEGRPGGLILDPTTGQITWPRDSEGRYPRGDYPVTLIVKDTTGRRASVSIQISVFPDTEPPQIILRNELISETAGKEIEFTVEARGGAPPYTFDVERRPKGATLDPTNGQFKWIPVSAYGEFPLRFIVTDRRGNQATASVIITISDPGEILIRLAAYPKATQEQTVTITGTIEYLMLENLNLTDENLDPIEFGANGSFQYPVNLQEGKNTIRILASDRNLATKRKEKTVEIIRDTDRPYFLVDGVRTTEITRKENDTTPISVIVADNTSPLASISASWPVAGLSQPEPDAKEQPMEIQVAELNEGENQLVAEDAAGNRARLKLIKSRGLVVDIENIKQRTNKDHIFVSGVVAGGYGKIRVTIGGQTVIPSQGKFGVEVFLPDEGENKIPITVQDEHEKTQTSITVIKDTKKPVFAYANQNVPSIDVSIENVQRASKLSIGVSDEGGLSTVRLNDKDVLSTDGPTWFNVEIRLQDLTTDSEGNMVGQLVAKDRATNEARLRITARKSDKEALEKRAEEALNENKYNEAWKALDILEKKHGLNASIRLSRGRITYEQVLEDLRVNRDRLEAYKRLKGYDKKRSDGTVEHIEGTVMYLESALADAEQYPPENNNIHLNRYYLGMCYYKLYTLARQIPYEDTIIQQNRRRAIGYFESFLNSVGDKLLELKTQADEADQVLEELK